MFSFYQVSKIKMTKRDKIKILLKATQNVSEIETGFKELIMSIPNDLIPGLEGIKDKFLKKFDDIYQQTLETHLDLYEKLVSEATIDACIAFYSSPEGQEFSALLPKINKGLEEGLMALNSNLAQEMLKELLQLDLPDKIMGAMGFIKLDPEMFGAGGGNNPFSNIFSTDQSDEDEDEEKEEDKPKPAPVTDAVTEADMEKLMSEWFKKKPE